MEPTIDTERCVGCRICELICSQATKGHLNPRECPLSVEIDGEGMVRVQRKGDCHCTPPLPCQEFCPVGAISVR